MTIEGISSRELGALRKTNDLLKRRVAELLDGQHGTAGFEREARMQRLVDERTSELRRNAERLFGEVRRRAEAEALLHSVQELAQVGGWMMDLRDGNVQATAEFYRILGIAAGGCEAVDSLLDCFDDELREKVERALVDAIGARAPFDIEGRARTGDGVGKWFRVQAKVCSELGVPRLIGAISDVTMRKLADLREAHSAKMESVGQLAAGIAHEINTPTQFVADNTQFLRSVFSDLVGLVDRLATVAVDGAGRDERARDVAAAMQTADLEYLRREIPLAIGQSLDGLTRIAKLVAAMKDYAHPGSDTKQPSDLNRAVEAAVVVSRNEWKYVADVKCDLDPNLPPVSCRVQDIGQVLVNMIVNAAHAIEDRFGRGDGLQGCIKLATKVVDGGVVIVVADNGAGMTEAVRKRIFDPFFTTKDVGRGTGQGLPISHRVVVDGHAGRIEVTSQPGVGTSFEIWLPGSGD